MQLDEGAKVIPPRLGDAGRVKPSLSHGLGNANTVKANDSVRVGTNLGATFAAALRNAFRITYGFGFLYDRNYAPQRTQE